MRLITLSVSLVRMSIHDSGLLKGLTVKKPPVPHVLEI